jgi:multiple sugar transport system permease protein/putative chitobiose transport system permease protein
MAARRAPLRTALLYAALTLAALASALPFLWALGASFRENAEIFRDLRPLSPWTFVPRQPSLVGYRAIFLDDGFHWYMLNSLLVGLAVTGLGLLVNSLAGFGFARFRFPGREPLFVAVLVTFMVPLEIIVIPLYIVVRGLGWVDSYWALIVPAVADAFSIFLLRQFFREIPQELVDAARIDGCGWVGIYWRIALPLVKPALITASLLAFIRQWDAFFWPLVATSSPQYTVVQVALNKYITEFVTFWDRLLAASVSASLPVLVLYFLLQRYYVQGVSTTGLR